MIRCIVTVVRPISQLNTLLQKLEGSYWLVYLWWPGFASLSMLVMQTTVKAKIKQRI